MRKSLPNLALLALATAASGQTVLSPAALSGYAHTFVNGADAGYVLTSGLLTQTVISVTGPRKGPVTTTVVEKGWRVEFGLPSISPNERLVSAILTTHGSINMHMDDFLVARYDGTGTITATEPTSILVPGQFTYPANLRQRVAYFDVTSALGTGRLASFRFFARANSYLVGGSSSSHEWSDPTLTLTYAPIPVPEPASLAALGLGALSLVRRRHPKR